MKKYNKEASLDIKWLYAMQLEGVVRLWDCKNYKQKNAPKNT